ncbi:Ferredoxin [Halalkaliarchaeum sp. AArc-CO]|uniref:2Fe-2S iron-sulfur cluster-binding protein n=1 Tax=unclassified Halalkaliarchaeum TaxID=2678344 RepID=UPI0026E58C3C|nr:MULTISPECIES: 2Fe-2S iron-sulfur cluster-binding protein [unclassified Halalkaliarchaeum]MDR5671555.1 2Fe-2S iron-sulfur cluster-binding protein [Halalkaliarchaeum sp. AArc-GB]UWG51055.1 Ferredoxin [Halalkaliarchaeum sp. AArc-CO]
MDRKHPEDARPERCSGGGCENGRQCDRSPSQTRRRNLLGVVATGGSLALAGCVGLFPEPERQTVPEPDEDDGENDEADPGPFDVEYLVQEASIEVARDENLLEAGEEQGWELPYQCRSGFCGQCLGHVDGDGHELVEMTNNDYDPLDDDAIADGYVLTCTGQPRGDFALETGVAGALTDETDEEDEADDETEDAETHAIEYVKQEATIDVPETENLLEAGEEQGWDLPYQCRVGVCGQCTARVDGDGHELVEMTDNDVLSDDEIEDGYVLTCTGQPRAEFSIETDESP